MLQCNNMKNVRNLEKKGHENAHSNYKVKDRSKIGVKNSRGWGMRGG